MKKEGERERERERNRKRAQRRAIHSYTASDNERRKSCAVGGRRAGPGDRWIRGIPVDPLARSFVGSQARSLARSLLSRAGSSREKFSRRRVVARVRGQDRAFRGVRGVGGGSPESVPQVGSRWDESSTVLDASARCDASAGRRMVEEDEVVEWARDARRGEVTGEGDEGQRGRALRAVSAPRGPAGVSGKGEVAVVVAVGG